MDLKTLNDQQLHRRYRRRLIYGVLTMLMLAVPAAVHSVTAISSLFNRPSDWIPADMPVRVEFDDFAKRFSVTDLVLISWEKAELGSASLASVTHLLEPLCEQHSADRSDVAETADDDRAAALDPAATAAINELLQTLGTRPLHFARSGSDVLAHMTASPVNLPRAAAIKRLSGSLIGPDGEQTAIIISLNETGATKRRMLFSGLRKAITAQLGPDGNSLSMVGGPVDGAYIDDASTRSILAFSPPSAVIAAILCFICLRSFVLTAVISAIAVIGQGVVLAAVHYSGSPMNAVLIVLPPLVFVLTISSGIHLSNYYLDALAEFPKATRAQAAAIAMRAGTMPCLLAASTTVVGLGSLTLVRLEPIRVFGAVATLGLLATLALLLLILPGAMMLYGGPRHISDRDLLHGSGGKGASRSWFARRLRLVLRQCLEHSTVAISLFIVGTLAMSAGLYSLNTSVNLPRMFDPTHPLRTQYQWFETHIGPTINGELLLRFPADRLESDAIDRLDLVRAAHVAVARADDVGGVLSPISFLPPVPKGRGVSATATRSVIRSQLVDPASAVGQLGYISRDHEAEVWRISFRLPMTTESDYGPEIKAVGATVAAALEESLSKVKASDLVTPQIVLTGGVKIAQEAQEILLRDLFTSFLSAFAVVAVVMMFLLRSFVGGLIAMFPNLFPTIGLFGYMGMSAMPLDIGSVMTASVALGIAVDDTIHLLSRFGSRRAAGMRRKRAAWRALQQCGLAMLHTTLVCGLSLLVYALSDFVPTRQFAFLMFGLLGIALVGDLILLPALMVSRWGRFLAKPVMADPAAEVFHDDHKPRPMDIRRLRFSGRRRNRLASK